MSTKAKKASAPPARAKKDTLALAAQVAAFSVEDWPIDRAIPYARNARKIPQAAVDKVAASIKEFGFRQPIAVDKEGVIVAGHTRLLRVTEVGAPDRPGPRCVRTYTDPNQCDGGKLIPSPCSVTCRPGHSGRCCNQQQA
jgi:ParB-like nuclease family protein